jgi:TRAP transporter TAXI family solute receptor
MQKEWFKLGFGAFVLILLVLGISYQFIDPAPPKKLSIATGTTSGSYYKFAQEYKKLLEKEKFELLIVPTQGSVEALKKLQNKEVDIAFVQGGVANEEEVKTLRSLASIYFEPLWIFYSEKFDFKYINELKGKKVSIGSEGSGTKPLALEILKQNSIDKTNTTLLELSNEAAQQALNKGEIDVLFSVISPSSKMVQSLLSNPKVKLLNIQRASAYSKKLHYLTPVSIGEGVVSLENNIPSSNITLLSTTATLVGQKDLHPDLIRLILKTAKQVHSTPSLFENNEIFPSKKYLQIPLHVDAKHYLEKGDSFLEKIFPFWIASSIDRLVIMIIPLLTLLIPIIKGALPLYRWRIRSSIYKWYKILHEIDLKLESLDKSELPKIKEDLEKMAEDIQKSSKIPLSYMGEYYDLRVHANLILGRIEKLLQK